MNFDEFVDNYSDFLVLRQVERPARIDCRHHVTNYIELAHSLLRRVFSLFPAPAAGDPDVIRFTAAPGDTFARITGVTEQSLAEVLGTPTNSIDDLNDLYGFIAHEVDKILEANNAGPGALGVLVVRGLHNLLHDRSLPTFRQKRLGSATSDGLMQILFDFLNQGQLSFRDVSDIMRVWFEVETVIVSVLETPIPDIIIPLSTDGSDVPKIAIQVAGPIEIAIPSDFDEFLRFVYPTGSEDATVVLKVAEARLPRGTEVDLMVRNSADNLVERANFATNNLRTITVTNLRCIVTLDPNRLDRQRIAGWPEHRFTTGAWAPFTVAVRADNIDINVRQFNSLVFSGLGLGLLGAPGVGMIAVALGIFADNVAEDLIGSVITDFVTGDYGLAALISDKTKALLGFIPPLVAGEAVDRFRVRWPQTSSRFSDHISYEPVQVNTTEGAHRFFTPPPPPLFPKPDLTRPPNIDDIIDGFDPEEIGWPSVFRDVFPGFEEKEEGDLSAHFEQMMHTNTSLAPREKLFTQLNIESFAVKDISLLNENALTEAKEGPRLLGRPVSQRAREAFLSVVKASSKDKDDGRFDVFLGGPDETLRPDRMVSRAIARSVLAVWMHEQQKPTKDEVEPDTLLRSVAPKSGAVDAYHKVFTCGHSLDGPLGPRVGSQVDPAQIELACNCVGPSRMLRRMNESGRLHQSFALEHPSLGRIDCRVEGLERVAVDFASFEESENLRDFHASPSVAVEGLTGRYRIARGTWRSFSLKARILMRPLIMPKACFSDVAAQGIFDHRSKIDILDATPFELHRANFIRELTHRQFIYLVAFHARIVDPATGSFLEPAMIAGIEGETVDIFRYDRMTDEQKTVFPTLLTTWMGQVLPLPLMYDPWFGLGDTLLEVRCEEGWIAMRRNYLLSDLQRYKTYRGLS